MIRIPWKQITVLTLSAATICAAVTLTQPHTVLEAAEDTIGTGRITVTGQGSVKVKPDIAYVDLGVHTQDTDAKAAQAANAENSAAVFDALKALGIKEEDMQTSNYNMYPSYDYSAKGEATITGYTVQNTVSVTIRDVTQVGIFVDAAIDAGANVANGIRFSINNSGAAYAEALVLAVANARQKATAIAGALHMAVGNPIEITENGGNYMPVAYEALDNVMSDVRANASPTPVQIGELEVSATITAIFPY